MARRVPFPPSSIPAYIEQSMKLFVCLISDIRSLPVTTIIPDKPVICIGAFRNIRLSELDLNIVHIRGFAALLQGRKEFRLPSITTSDYDSPIPPVRAVRSSCDGWDILATSFKDGDKMHTLITAISYPAYGIQLQNKKESARKTPSAWPSLPAPGPGRGGNARPAPARGGYAQPAPRRAPREDKWLIDTPDKDFFVRGVVGSPSDESKYLQLVARDDPEMRQKTRQRAVLIRNMISSEYTAVWARDSFYDNLEFNHRAENDQGITMIEVWQDEWRKIIAGDIASWYDPAADTFNIPQASTHWWTDDKSGTVWPSIIRDGPMLSAWLKFLDYLSVSWGTQSRIRPSKTQPALAGPGVIKLPAPRQKTRASEAQAAPKPAPEITQMQARIQALEAKLDRSRQEANNAHLLQQVLSKLDQPSALRY